MINITAIETYYQNTRYNERLSEASREKWAKPIDREGALNFGTREEYLQWVKEWKAEYKANTARSRQAKRSRKHGPNHDPQAIDKVARARWTAGALLFARCEGKKRSRELRALRLQIEGQR